MDRDIFRFQFESDVPLEEAEMSLHLAIFAIEGLWGQARVRLDAGYVLDKEGHALVIDGTHEVGSTLVRVFTGLILREFGEDAFYVERVEALPHSELHEICV